MVARASVIFGNYLRFVKTSLRPPTNGPPMKTAVHRYSRPPAISLAISLYEVWTRNRAFPGMFCGKKRRLPMSLSPEKRVARLRTCAAELRRLAHITRNEHKRRRLQFLADQFDQLAASVQRTSLMHAIDVLSRPRNFWSD